MRDCGGSVTVGQGSWRCTGDVRGPRRGQRGQRGGRRHWRKIQGRGGCLGGRMSYVGFLAVSGRASVIVVGVVAQRGRN